MSEDQVKAATASMAFAVAMNKACRNLTGQALYKAVQQACKECRSAGVDPELVGRN